MGGDVTEHDWTKPITYMGCPVVMDQPKEMTDLEYRKAIIKLAYLLHGAKALESAWYAPTAPDTL